MMTDPAREQSITRFGLRPLPGAAHVTNTQIEQARREARCCRSERIQAANEAVDAYLRESGTRNYQAAFRHIQRTRPELFAGTQVPMGLMAANFNPYHDKLGRFTTKDGAAGGGDDGLDGQGGGQTKHASIRGHAYNSKDFQTCVAASIRSLIAAGTRIAYPAKTTSKRNSPRQQKSSLQNPTRELTGLAKVYRQPPATTEHLCNRCSPITAVSPPFNRATLPFSNSPTLSSARDSLP